MFWKNKKEKKPEMPDINHEKVNELLNYGLKMKFFKKTLFIKPLYIRRLAMITAIVIAFFMLRNLRHLGSSFKMITDFQKDNKNLILNEDENYLSEEKLRKPENIEKFKEIQLKQQNNEMRINKMIKRNKIDSLIENNNLTSNNLKAIEEAYPDSICGC